MESLAFDEMPGEDELRERWQSAYTRWSLLCHSLSSPSSNGGSACRQSFFSTTRVRRSDGASADVPSLSFPSNEPITLHTDGAYDKLSSRGGWAAILDIPGFSEPVRGSGGISRATNNRAELIAVIKGLEETPEGARVRVVSDSTYVVRGINEWMAKWNSQGWRAGNEKHKRPLQSLDLWLRLDGLLTVRQVTAEWVKGHAGHLRNEECDSLASRAMRNVQVQ